MGYIITFIYFKRLKCLPPGLKKYHCCGSDDRSNCFRIISHFCPLIMFSIFPQAFLKRYSSSVLFFTEKSRLTRHLLAGIYS